MLIRNAKLTDIPRLIDLGYAIHAESKFSTLNSRRQRQMCIRDSCCFVAEDTDGQLIGVFIGCVEEYFFSRSLMAHSILIYVHPKWRGSSAAVKFIHAFRKWALNRKALELCVGVASGVTIGRTDRFLRRLGFKVTGGNYSMVLEEKEGRERRIH